MNLPKNPKLEDLSKEQLITVIRRTMAARIPGERELASIIWESEIKKNDLRMRQNIERSEMIHGNRIAFLENQREFTALMDDYNKLSKYFDTIVCPKDGDK